MKSHNMQGTEYKQALVEDNCFKAEELTIDRFEHIASIQPDATAIVEIPENDSSLRHAISYAQLSGMAVKVKERLSLEGIGQESIVGIDADHSVASIAAILGTMKIGACFLPLDSSLPELRIERIIRESKLSAIIMPEEKIGRHAWAGTRLITFQECMAADAGAPRQAAGAFNENAACVIYTSGSTGDPKGVIITQQGLANHGKCFSDMIGLTREDVVLQFATLAFDAAYEEIFPCLCQGAQLVLCSSSMKEDISIFLQTCEEQQIAVLDIPTAYWHLLTRLLSSNELQLPASIRTIVIGGEQASFDQLRYWKKNCTHRLQLLNTYGPTEATIITTAAELIGDDAFEDNEVSLGTCIAGTSITLHYPDTACRDKEAGEIYISGLGVARGYMNAPRLTAERFLPSASGRSYQTGDLAVTNSSGSFVFKGRNDNQVKLNGHRIQLEEVEKALLSHPSITSCAVLMKDNWRGGKQLVAYCILKREETSLPFEEEPLSVKDLRNFLAQKLPGYMVPAEFSFIEKFILNSNGKIDRRKLPEIGFLDRQKRRLPGYQQPRPGMETRLAEIWCDVLDLEIGEIGAEDPFEYLGGNSLYSIQVRYKAQKASLLFKAHDLHLRQTIRGLAECTQEAGGTFERIRHTAADYAAYASNMAKVVAREIGDYMRGPWLWEEKKHLQAVKKFYARLSNKDDIFYIFFTPNLLHWLSTTLSFVPPDCNIVLLGAGLRSDEAEWIVSRFKRPFLNLADEIDINLIWDILFEVNKKNFGWLDIDCFIMNPSLFGEMRVMSRDVAINSVWTHAACGPTKRPFHVLETYFLFFNVDVIEKLRKSGILQRPSVKQANRRQTKILKKLIPADRDMRKQLDSHRGKALMHRLLKFEFDPLILYQLLANACGYKLNRVRFFTEIDSFNLHNYYSDEAMHVYPSIRHYDTWDRSDIDQKLRLAADYILMTSMMAMLPASYLERKRALEEKIRQFKLDIEVMRAKLHEYLAFHGMTKTFTRKEFRWLDGQTMTLDNLPSHLLTENSSSVASKSPRLMDDLS
jgi:amino acid adenylation domain-containing protein